ncbi:hypothetical protein PybrP1_002650 [[Pythium] brassicae (nom. inval.)]|nr:hypothetical protein PybrP1_002650 [[Pythium] brassicae (nom. inval.)]
MTTLDKKRKGSGDAADLKPTKRTLGSSSRTAASSTPATFAAFSLESIVASVRAATAAAIPDAPSGDLDRILANATVHFLTHDRASWVYHVPRWHRRLHAAATPPPTSYASWFDDVWRLHPTHHDAIKMFGRDVLTPRFQQAYMVSYRFSGNTFEAQSVPPALLRCVEALQAIAVNAETGESLLRGVLVNWYAHGEHYMGPHSDSESSLFPCSPVLSLSLGATRRFVFSAKAGRAAAEPPTQRLELELQDGDLLVMGGTTQRTHKHALPKMKKCLARRVSVTLRCFK